MSTSTPSPVTTTACSSWAERRLSRVTTVQPSASTSTSGPPRSSGLRGDEPGILHLHGRWRRPGSIVLGVDRYLNVRDAPHAAAVREALRLTHSLLFIGCGATAEEPNIGAWLRGSGEGFAGAEYRNDRLEKDGDVAWVQAQHPRSSGCSCSATDRTTRRCRDSCMGW